MKTINPIMNNRKVVSIIIDLLIPILLYFSLQNDFLWASWILFSLVVLIRLLITVKS